MEHQSTCGANGYLNTNLQEHKGENTIFSPINYSFLRVFFSFKSQFTDFQ